MSADNYGVIHSYEDAYGLSMGFASVEEPLDLSHPYFTGTLEECRAEAESEYFEYGWSYHDDIDFFEYANAQQIVISPEAFDRLEAMLAEEGVPDENLRKLMSRPTIFKKDQ